MQETSLWDWVLPFVGFFSGVGEEYVAAQHEPATFGIPNTLIPSDSFYTRSLLSELQAGWSQDTLVSLWGPWYVVAIFFVLLFLTGICYCAFRIIQIRQAERQAVVKARQSIVSEDIPRTQLRWQRIIDEISGDDPGKWRLAILEADIMLNELLDSLGYKGETIADKMKQIDVSMFNTIDYAWEAHKVRNVIAHEGSSFELTDREARRVIRMYERVFREFKFIS
jgi:cell division protein FtsL